jgi:hypothetical protein
LPTREAAKTVVYPTVVSLARVEAARHGW